jgi:hypothetical protein
MIKVQNMMRGQTRKSQKTIVSKTGRKMGTL